MRRDSPTKARRIGGGHGFAKGARGVSLAVVPNGAAVG